MTKEQSIRLNNSIVEKCVKPQMYADDVFDSIYNIAFSFGVFTKLDIERIKTVRNTLIGLFNNPKYYGMDNMFDLEGISKARGEKLTVFDEWDEFVTKMTEYIKENYKKISNIFKNNPWECNNGKYTTYFHKKENYWVFGLYINDGMCIGEKKCHKWHNPKYFTWFVEKCFLTPDESDVDCTFLD